VTSTAVEVVACVSEAGQPVKVTGVRADDDQFVVVTRSDVLSVGGRVGGDLSPSTRDQLTVVSRWVGHTVEITTHAGQRLIGNVVGYEYAEEGDVDLNVLITPNDHVRNPHFNEYAIPLDELDTILDSGT
jgi:hypothetical protein